MKLTDKIFLRFGKHFFDEPQSESADERENISSAPIRTYHLPNKSGYDDIKELIGDSHVLIAGTTRSGKSVLLNDIIYTLLCTSAPIQTPNGCKMVLIDPKMVELSVYKNIPHCVGYASSVEDILDLLERCVAEMMNRYEYMEQKHLKVYDKEPMYIIFDELADIMTTAQRKALPLLQRIGQLGAASKVFLILASQAPNRQVIPANLTLNLGTRVALRCYDKIESKQVIKEYGAEKLPRYGKCLVSNWNGVREMSIPLTSEEELASIIRFWENQKTAS